MNLSSCQWDQLTDALMFWDSKDWIELFHTNQKEASSQTMDVGEGQQNM